MRDIQVQGDQVNFLFKGTCQEAASLKKKLQSQIYNYCIDRVIFYTNTSKETEEMLALRFGLLVLNQDYIVKGKLDVTGPKMVMSNDMMEIKTIHNTPIVYLRKDEVLKCEFILDKKSGKDHQKYNVVYAIRFVKQDDDFKFYLGLTGAVSFEQIMAQL